MARMSAATKPTTLSSQNHHIATRFSHGVNEELIRDIGSKRNAADWFEKQLVPSRFSDARADAVRSWFPGLSDSPSVAWAKVNAQETSAWQYGFDFTSYTVARKLLTRRQVHDVMADFWSNLLYIPAGEDRSFPWRMDYDRAIRARSLNSFRTLLRAAVVHPAMSGWLNNSSNTKEGINENLGRELLELFTVGSPAGYDEDDVKNSARLLTGYRVKVFDGYAATYDPGAALDRAGEGARLLAPQHQPRRAGRGHGLPGLPGPPSGHGRSDRSPALRPVRLGHAIAVGRHSGQQGLPPQRHRHPHDAANAGQAPRVPGGPQNQDAHPGRGCGRRGAGSGNAAHGFVLGQLIRPARPVDGRRHGPAAVQLAPTRWISRDQRDLGLAGARPAVVGPELVARRQLVEVDRAVPAEGRHPAADLVAALARRSGRAPVTHAARPRLDAPRCAGGCRDVLEISTSKSYAKASSVPDWAWIVIRATVLNHPDGMLR